MSIKGIFIREVAVANDHNTIHEAALFMRKAHVGCLVVVNGRKIPVGIVTDRDVVLSVVAAGLEPDDLKITEIMTPDPTVVHEDASIWSTIQTMRDKGIRRLPVVNGSQELVGIITADDMLDLLSKQLHSLIEVIDQEQIREINRLG
jgi:CBS domain-containing protein